jgi:putative acetyltransferase
LNGDDIVVAAETPDTSEILELLGERDAHFDRLYAGEDRNARPVDLEREDLRFFTVRVSGQLAGCGALVVHPAYGELKRFYVRPQFRGWGLGLRLVEAADQEARTHGCRVLRLETGVLEPEAIGLYRSAGFRERECFGDYRPDPLSVFMEKEV